MFRNRAGSNSYLELVQDLILEVVSDVAKRFSDHRFSQTARLFLEHTKRVTAKITAVISSARILRCSYSPTRLSIYSSETVRAIFRASGTWSGDGVGFVLQRQTSFPAAGEIQVTAFVAKQTSVPAFVAKQI